MTDNRPEAHQIRQAVALIWLDSSNEQISAVTGLTPEAVQQLRDKLNEETEE